jgi:hypothetical protein
MMEAEKDSMGIAQVEKDLTSRHGSVGLVLIGVVER